MTDVLREKIDLGASGFPVGPAAACFTFARHAGVVVCHRHRQQHLGVRVIWKYAVGSQVKESKAQKLTARKNKNQKQRSFGAPWTPVRCRPCVPLFSSPTIAQAT